MINAKSTLKHLGISTTSPLRAIQQIRKLVEAGEGPTSLLRKITDVDKAYNDHKMALYIVQSVVETAVKSEMFDPEETIMHAEARASTLMNNPTMQWAFAREVSNDGTTINVGKGDTIQTIAGKDVVVKSDGTLKKGGKQVIANELYKQHVIDGGMSNQDFIKLLMKEADMTKPGATTYAYNARKEFGHQPVVEEKQGVNKQTIANQLYQTYVIDGGFTKEEFMERAMKELNTSKLGAQTYFYAARKAVDPNVQK